MKLLISLIGTVYDNGGEIFTSQNIIAQINRYKFLGNEISILIRCEQTNNPIGNKIDLSKGDLNLIYVKKVNTIRGLLIDNKYNDKIIQNAVKQADLCVCHLPSNTSVQTIKYARKYAKPYLNVIVGCPWDAYWNYNWKGKIMAPFFYYSLKKIQNKATHSIYVTKYFLQSRYPTKGKQLGVSDVQLEPTSEYILNKRLKRLEQMSQDCKIFTIATAAALIPYKGQRFVIEAISRLKKKGYTYIYHLIGSGNQTSLKKLASKLGVEDQIVFHGMVSHEEVSKILDNVDIYIQPSLQEGLPRAMVEAMSRGCVAMGSNIAGIPELVNKDYLFTKKDVNSIVRILLQINRDHLVEMSIHNFNKAKEYDTELLQRKVHEFLLEFMNDIVKK